MSLKNLINSDYGDFLGIGDLKISFDLKIEIFLLNIEFTIFKDLKEKGLFEHFSLLLNIQKSSYI